MKRNSMVVKECELQAKILSSVINLLVDQQRLDDLKEVTKYTLSISRDFFDRMISKSDVIVSHSVEAESQPTESSTIPEDKEDVIND